MLVCFVCFCSFTIFLAYICVNKLCYKNRLVVFFPTVTNTTLNWKCLFRQVGIKILTGRKWLAACTFIDLPTALPVNTHACWCIAGWKMYRLLMGLFFYIPCIMQLDNNWSIRHGLIRRMQLLMSTVIQMNCIRSWLLMIFDSDDVTYVYIYIFPGILVFT